MVETYHFDSLPKEVRKRLEEIASNPVPIELRSDGTLNIDENIDLNIQIDNISKLIPDPPSMDGITDEELRKEIRTVFQVTVIQKVLGYTNEFVENQLQKGLTYSQVRQELTQLGKDVEIILSAVARKFMVKQATEQQWGKYSLRYEEVIKLESVASLRREINVRRSNWEMSPEYLNSSKEVKAQKEAQYEAELASVTDDLWRILHLGVNYLTPRERLRIKVKTETFSKSDYKSYVNDELIRLRCAYLEQWRSDPSNFKVVKPKS